MKNKVINTVVCDVRGVTEESLAGFDRIAVNAAIVITGERSRELLNRYPVTLNTTGVVEVPDGQNVHVKSVNGKCEIGPDADGTDTVLVVNGKLFIASGSAEALKSYYKIMVNGEALVPESCWGQHSNLTVNGKVEYYPDGAAILEPNTKIDDLFISRAAHSVYHCSGNLFFLDTRLDADRILAKELRFSAKRIVIAKSLAERLLPLFGEKTQVVCVSDGTALIDGDLELKPKTIRKYGAKLCVCGDVSIEDAEALSSLEYLFADGTVSVNQNLEEAFDKIESVYKELKVIDPDVGNITDRPMVRIGALMLRKYPKGVQISDCAKVTLSDELSAEDIMEKLRISDCALVVCTKEQEDAVHMVAEDVAMIRVAGAGQADDAGETVGGLLGSVFGKLKDTQMINAVEYKM